MSREERPGHECDRHDRRRGHEDVIGLTGPELPIRVESHAVIIVVPVSTSADPSSNQAQENQAQGNQASGKYETILVERADGVVTITFNRVRSKNAVNGVMWAELIEELNIIQHNGDDRVVVFTGAGGEFCSGADLSVMMASDVSGASWGNHFKAGFQKSSRHT